MGGELAVGSREWAERQYVGEQALGIARDWLRPKLEPVGLSPEAPW